MKSVKWGSITMFKQKTERGAWNYLKKEVTVLKALDDKSEIWVPPYNYWKNSRRKML